MKNYILGIATVIILVIAGFVTYQYGKQSSQKGTSLITPVISQSANKPTTKLTPTPTTIKESDSELIKKALLTKNNWTDDGTMTIVVSFNDGKYAKGTVNSQGGGGYFFAIKIGDKWEIVADGNGIIECSSLTKYPDFPKTLIPECYDSAAGKIIKR
jgi:hypothetical protein